MEDKGVYLSTYLSIVHNIDCEYAIPQALEVDKLRVERARFHERMEASAAVSSRERV